MSKKDFYSWRDLRSFDAVRVVTIKEYQVVFFSEFEDAQAFADQAIIDGYRINMSYPGDPGNGRDYYTVRIS